MSKRSRAARHQGSPRRSSAGPPVAGHGTSQTAQPTVAVISGPAPIATDAAADAAALVVSYVFDAGPVGGEPFDAVIRLSGRRRGVTGIRTKADAFSVTETVHGVLPGSGPVAATSWVYHVAQGDWDVEAAIVSPPSLRRETLSDSGAGVHWSWRSWRLVPRPGPLKTRWALLAPLAATPAVLPGSFTFLALAGIVAALAVQPAVLAHEGLDATGPVLASLAGLLAGLAGAKGWYMALKGPSLATLRQGWSVDGFLLVAPIVALLAAGAQGIPAAAYLDGATPGIFLAVAIGRVGCFLTGCCAGRPTVGFGIWSSDRRVAMRRVPAQLIESAVGLALAVISAGVILGHLGSGRGLVFVAAMVAYVAARQGLLRLRAEARPFSWRRAPGPGTA